MNRKPLLSRLIALVLVVVIGLMGCSSNGSGLSGNFGQDTLTVVQNIKQAIDLPDDNAQKADLQELIRKQINDYASRYRRDTKVAGSRTYTTMQTALNSLAGYYTSYGNRPLPEKLKKRLKQELKQVEFSLQRGI